VNQHEIRPAAGSKRKPKRIGRGNGSGHGTYSCRGIKGQKARAGGGVRPLFEGGQNPLVRRLPYKRGFNNVFRTAYAIVNVERLNMFEDGAEVTPEGLVSAGIIKDLHNPVKILGEGQLDKRLIVKAHRFSESARSKIEARGGKAEVVA